MSSAVEKHRHLNCPHFGSGAVPRSNGGALWEKLRSARPEAGAEGDLYDRCSTSFVLPTEPRRPPTGHMLHEGYKFGTMAAKLFFLSWAWSAVTLVVVCVLLLSPRGRRGRARDRTPPSVARTPVRSQAVGVTGRKEGHAPLAANRRHAEHGFIWQGGWQRGCASPPTCDTSHLKQRHVGWPPWASAETIRIRSNLLRIWKTNPTGYRIRQIWPNSGEVRPTSLFFGRVWAKLAHNGPDSAKTRSNSEFGRFWAKIGRNRAIVGGNRAKHLPKRGRFRSLTVSGPTLAQIGPYSAELAQTRSAPGQVWTNSGLTKIGPTSTETATKSDRIWATCGQIWASFGQSRARFRFDRKSLRFALRGSILKKRVVLVVLPSGGTQGQIPPICSPHQEDSYEGGEPCGRLNRILTEGGESCRRRIRIPVKEGGGGEALAGMCRGALGQIPYTQYCSPSHQESWGGESCGRLNRSPTKGGVMRAPQEDLHEEGGEAFWEIPLGQTPTHGSPPQ